jgi:hypothetical protein
MQVTVGKEESQFLQVNPAAGARAPTTGVNPWQRPNTTNRSACSGSRSAPGLISRPSSLPYRPSSRTDCGHPAVHAGGATKFAQVTHRILSEVTDSLHPARPSGDTFLVFSCNLGSPVCPDCFWFWPSSRRLHRAHQPNRSTRRKLAQRGNSIAPSSPSASPPI